MLERGPSAVYSILVVWVLRPWTLLSCWGFVGYGRRCLIVEFHRSGAHFEKLEATEDPPLRVEVIPEACSGELQELPSRNDGRAI